MDASEEDLRAQHFRQLRWSLQGLAATGSDQPGLFADSAVTPEHLALAFDQSASTVRSLYADALSGSQIDGLAAIDRAFVTISRDGADFDIELWTEAALVTSAHWIRIRELAALALDAFGWSIDTARPDSAEQPAVLNKRQGAAG